MSLQKHLVTATGFSYQYLLKPVFFLADPEKVHENITTLGEFMGKFTVSQKLAQSIFFVENPMLTQNIAGIDFKTPIGLSAGFDYEAKLTQILPNLSFGFETVGTITNLPFEGNGRPRLGRLPKSKSLLVNKGFKNEGADKVIDKLINLQFAYPVGISIGRTNTIDLKTQKQSVEDIVMAFSKFEKSKLKHKYYELNISCPNLKGDISFYPLRNLKELLSEIEKINIKRPVFIKMPIEKSDKDIMEMLEVISKFSITGVIFGNLQKNREDLSFHPKEIDKFKDVKGNFSGKPTWSRSNHLIKLAYSKYKQKLIVIGCGGVFSAEDAFEKICLGASLVQLITGMIFQGPQLVTEINLRLIEILKQNGFKNISEAIGCEIG